MYAVVGCSDCGNLWLLSDPGETAECPRCGTRHQTDRLRRFFESEDREEAREVRAAMLADRSDEGQAFENLPSVGELERRLDDVGIDDETFLSAAGVDPEEAAAAGDVRTRSQSRPRQEIVRDALRTRETPTETDVIEYAAAHGVPADAARDLLGRLLQNGEVVENDGRYRLV